MASVRRLSAIMFASMVSSTASVQVDEAAEALKIRDEQVELVRLVLATHQGREIKSMRDGFLVEFDSALRAVQCAIDIQRHSHESNSQPGLSRSQLRIGVHFGEVEQRETDTLGDTVTIASRIEPHATPGGVCISGEVFNQIRNKVPSQLEKLPPMALKGPEVPIDLYRVVLPWTAREAHPHGNGPTRIAVLPFTNMSPDPADLYFADGLTEELITVLSQLRELRVIARTSVMQYKSTAKEVSQIGANLGVSSVLEGSVRRTGHRICITAQLIDVNSQEHVWANSYDRELDYVSLIQTEVAKQVVDALKIELGSDEAARLEARLPVQPDSYLAYLKGRSLLQSVWSEAVFKEARQQFELALSLDPTNARAHSGLADAMIHLRWGRYERGEAEQDTAVRENVVRALALDPDLAEAHCSLGNIVWDDYKNLEAEKEFRLALSLNPSHVYAHFSLAHLLLTYNRPEEALREFVLAEELDPMSIHHLRWNVTLLVWLGRPDEAAVKLERLRELDRQGINYQDELGFYFYHRADFERALQTADRMDDLKPAASTVLRIAVHSAMGRMEEAWKLLKELETRSDKPALDDLAFCHAVVGDLDGCFQRLGEEFERRQLRIQVWRIEPALEPVRLDHRFGRLLEKLNLAPVPT